MVSDYYQSGGQAISKLREECLSAATCYALEFSSALVLSGLHFLVREG